jgi:hypothetical protein
MPDTPKDKDQEKGDEVLRRLLKIPPEPKPGKGNKEPKADEKPTEE